MPLARHPAAILATGLVVLALPGVASAATIPVTTTLDTNIVDGECSLYEAVQVAQLHSDGLDCTHTGTFGDDTIDLEGDEYEVSEGGILLEAGAGKLTIDGEQGSTTIDANDTGRIFSIDAGAVVVIEGTVLMNGHALDGVDAVSPGADGIAGSSGGCIFSAGDLTLQNSAVRDCEAGDGGAGADGAPEGPGGDGGVGGGGGGILSTGGSLTLIDTDLTGNQAGDGGNGGRGGDDDDTPGPGNGGAAGGGGPGGGVQVVGDLTMTGGTVSNNTAGAGGTGGDGGQDEGFINASGGGGGVGGTGGGLTTALGVAQLEGVAIEDNDAGNGGNGGLSDVPFQEGQGGSGGAGGGWYLEDHPLPPVELQASTITGNAAGAAGVGPGLAAEIRGGPGGGIRADNASLTVERSTIAGNTAGGVAFVGEAGSGGGISLFESDLDMQDSAVTGNDAGDAFDGGEGLGGDGGGIYVGDTAGAEVTIGNSTIAENSAGSTDPQGLNGRGGGIMHAGTSLSLFIATTTVAGNNVPADSDGGGLYTDATISLLSTIIAGNEAGNESFNCDGNIFDEGFNLTSDDSCPVDTAGDPKLGPLANNGGPTETMGLNAGSAALDQIPDGSAEACPPADQRGVERPVGSACDIGAFEGVLAPPGGPGGPGGPTGKAAFGQSTLITLSLGAKKIKAKGPVTVVITNGNAFEVTGTLSGKTTKAVPSASAAANAAAKKKKAKRVSLKAKKFTVAGSSKKTVKLKLPAKLRKLLKRAGKLSLRVKAVVTDPSGNSRTVSRVVKPKRKKPKRKK